MNPPPAKPRSEKKTEYFAALEGLRGVAILSVVIFHLAYFNPAQPLQRALFLLTQAGFYGVQIFFVLSGFLITHSILSAGDRFDWREYAARRAARILPPFILSLLVLSALEYYWHAPAGLGLSTLAHLFTLPHFSRAWPGFNVAYWTLFIEIHFYILLPVFYLALRRFTKQAIWIVFGLCLVVPAVIRLATHLPADADQAAWNHHAALFPRSFDNFAPGILFAIIWSRWRDHPRTARLAPLLAVAGALVLVATYLAHAATNANATGEWGVVHPILIWRWELFRFSTAWGSFLTLFIIFVRREFWLNRLLCSVPLTFVGLVSYEWFLFHYPPAQWLQERLGNASGSAAVYFAKTLLPFCVTLAFAAALHIYFSAPIIARVKEALARRRKRLAPTAPEPPPHLERPATPALPLE